MARQGHDRVQCFCSLTLLPRLLDKTNLAKDPEKVFFSSFFHGLSIGNAIDGNAGEFHLLARWGNAQEVA